MNNWFKAVWLTAVTLGALSIVFVILSALVAAGAFGVLEVFLAFAGMLGA